jgi:hypothetical protein
MFVQSLALEFWQVEGNGRSSILCLSEEFMSGEMVFGKLNEFWRWLRRAIFEDLAVDMVTQLLNINLIVSCLRWYCASSACVISIQ